MLFSIILVTIFFFLSLIEVLLHLLFFSLYFIIPYFYYFNFFKFIKDLALFNKFIKIYFYTIFIINAIKGFLIFICSIEVSVYEFCLLETFLVLLGSLHYEGSLDGITFSIERFDEIINLNYLKHNDLNHCDLNMKALPENAVLFAESVTSSEENLSINSSDFETVNNVGSLTNTVSDPQTVNVNTSQFLINIIPPIDGEEYKFFYGRGNFLAEYNKDKFLSYIPADYLKTHHQYDLNGRVNIFLKDFHWVWDWDLDKLVLYPNDQFTANPTKESPEIMSQEMFIKTFHTGLSVGGHLEDSSRRVVTLDQIGKKIEYGDPLENDDVTKENFLTLRSVRRHSFTKTEIPISEVHFTDHNRFFPDYSGINTKTHRTGLEQDDRWSDLWHLQYVLEDEMEQTAQREAVENHSPDQN